MADRPKTGCSGCAFVIFVVDFVRRWNAAELQEGVMRADSGIPEAVEVLVRNVIGCALAVHKELGPGFLERVYREAMYLELEARKLPFEAEKPIVVIYRGYPIAGQRADLIVGGAVVVELKAVAAIEPIHVAQVLSYLKTLPLRLGLVINFHEMLLRDGIRRIVR
jgi:GxxExxY protein